MRTPLHTRDRTAAQRWASRAGLVIGLAAAAAVVLAFRVPGGEGLPGASVRFTATPTGELSVAPAGVVVERHDLRAGGELAGDLAVTNLTGKRRAVRLLAVADTRDLEASLRVEIGAGGSEVFSGTLAELRSRGTRAVVLRRGERRSFTIAVSVLDDAPAAARAVDVTLKLSSGAARPA